MGANDNIQSGCADGETIEAPHVLADVRYAANERLLLVGEADFTFAAALCKCFGDCAALTATSLEPRADLLARFGTPLARRLASLEEQLCAMTRSIS